MIFRTEPDAPWCHSAQYTSRDVYCAEQTLKAKLEGDEPT